MIILLLLCPSLFSQQSDSIVTPKLKLDLILFDLPYQLDAAKTVGEGNINFGSFLRGYANPSMQQSLALTGSLYSAAHFGLDNTFKKDGRYKKKSSKFFHLSSLLFTDIVLIYSPLGDGWLHEEYHRAAMTRFQVNSFNEMNTFPIGAEVVSVSRIRDEDLIRFKLESPHDFIRMHVAGIEGQYLLIDKLQKENFFYNSNLSHHYLYVLSTSNSIAYLNGSTKPSFADPLTDRLTKQQTDISSRDFTGIDFTAWVYDLFNPDEPYESRGIHPSGIGIDRYIKTTDLSSDAKDYLKKQSILSWLNCVSPMVLGFNSISWNHNYRFNFALRHFLTSFGSDITFNVFLKGNQKNLIFRFHHASNYKKSFPSVEAELYEFPAILANNRFLIGLRMITGVQPKYQSFTTNKSAFLGLAECKFDWLTKGLISPFAQLSFKTKGWVAGNEFLDSNTSFRLGLSARLK